MPEHKRIKISGHVTDIFTHRFVVQMNERKILADLGPRGAEAFALRVGLAIIAEGEMKPSELKIERIAKAGEASVEIEHKKPHHHGPHAHGPHAHGLHEHHHPADPEVARRAVEAAGLQPIGAPRRKPKHFEVLARNGEHLVECHVELDGRIRKEKPVAPDDHKWSDDIAAAA